MSHAWVFEWESPNSPKQKKGNTGEEQSQEHANHFHVKSMGLFAKICPCKPNCQICILL
jgi:adenine-specific DNA glycosylase